MRVAKAAKRSPAKRRSLADLAVQAGVGISTVQAIEAATDAATAGAAGLETTRDYRAGARAESLTKIATALGKAGVTLLSDNDDGPGIRCKPKDKGK